MEIWIIFTGTNLLSLIITLILYSFFANHLHVFLSGIILIVSIFILCFIAVQT